MIDQLLKIASEDKANAEKLAFVDEVLSQNFEFKDELIVEQQELLERVDESLEKLGFGPFTQLYDHLTKSPSATQVHEAVGIEDPEEILRQLKKNSNFVKEKMQQGGLKTAELSPETIQAADSFGRTLGRTAVGALARNSLPVEKQANIGAGFKQGLGLAGAGIAGMVGTALVSDMYHSAKSALTKGRNFERMVQAEPELKQYPADKVKAYFNTLHEKGGPEMSGDPVLAAAFVKQQLDFHGASIIDQVNKIVGIRSELGKSKGLGKLDFMSMAKMRPQSSDE
jgi:hypothetical protein